MRIVSSIALAIVSLVFVAACDRDRSIAEGDRNVASFDGVEVAYTVTGNAPTTVVLIHGWMCDRGYWRQQVEPLADRFRVIAVDLPGHGASGDGRETWSLEAYGRDVRAVVEELDLDRVVLIGHSMGGPVALEAARQMPDRVVGIVGIDTLHNAEWSARPEQIERLIAAYESDFVGTCTNFVTNMFADDADRALVERVRDDMCGGESAIGVELMRVFPGFDAADALRAVEKPVRAINAAANPTAVEINRKYNADFEVILMEDVGHFPMLERPDEFNRRLLEVVGELVSGDEP